MHNIEDFDCLDLILANGKITTIIDTLTGAQLKSFHQRLVKPKAAKIYILKEGEDYLYVGATTQSLTTRFGQGFRANGKAGYHGYKWKVKEKVQLYVWCFDGLGKMQIESIEAEFAFLIRKKTGCWPLAQNEIHFNNVFRDGKVIAEKLFKWTQ